MALTNSQSVSVTLVAVVGHRPHSAPTRRHLFLHDEIVPRVSAPAESGAASERLRPSNPSLQLLTMTFRRNL
jgi:hypothetical protein